jgi:formylglycine-generating enzyme required for sulfatase activity
MQEVMTALDNVSAVTFPSTTIAAVAAAPVRSTSRRRAGLLAAIAVSTAAAILAVVLLSVDSLFPTATGDNPGAAVNKLTTGPENKQPTSAAAPNVEKPQPPEMDLVRIEPGEFMMGGSDSDDKALKDEKPQHKVHISQPFLLGKFEVTQQQFRQVMGFNPSAFSAQGRFKDKVKDVDTSKHPVDSVPWDMAIKFCNRLSEMHNLEPYYKIDGQKISVRGGSGFRLPTEAEWEYACRGDTRTIWSFGNDFSKIGEYAWYAENSGGKSHPVGEKKPNPFGLYDMHGNVPEWCWDNYDAEYYLKGGKVFDPVGPGLGLARVYRGGAWDLGLAKTRSSARNALNVATPENQLGVTYGGTSVGVVYGQYLTIVGLRVAKNEK